ncbi:MAG: peptide deformylase [Cyanobacteria bacterium SIG30]|nr:peptide deformylase [Cyanobacteria bacterium SIG30]
MAILKIVKYGDPRLRQKTKDVLKFSKKIKVLVADMLDTMYANNGVGLAAPQVGEALRIFVIDVSEPNEPYNPIVFINPKIIKKAGAMNSYEGCLSFPQAYTNVKRYSHIIIKAQNLDGRFFTMESKGDTLLTKALQHEFDHLNGILFVDHARDVDETNKILEEFQLNPIESDKWLKEEDLEAEIQAQPKNVEEQMQEAVDGEN